MKLFFEKHNHKIEKIISILNQYSIVFHALLACMICFCAEIFSRHSLVEAMKFVWHTPITFLYNAMIIFITFLPVYLFKRRALVRVVITFVWLILGAVNGCILAERVTPFGFTDLKLIGDLFAMNSTYFTPVMGIMAILVAVLCIAVCVYLYRKGPVFKGKLHRSLVIAIVASCYLWVPMVTNAAVKGEVLTDYFDNIAQGYERYGFVYGFSSSIVDRGMAKPDNYTEEAVNQVMDSVSANMIAEQKMYMGDSYASAISDQVNDSVSANSIQIIPADPNNPDSPNIVLVLLESFVDPTEMKFLTLSEDPVPNFHYLEQNYSSGHLSVPVVGAGTANTEFEVLTGMSMQFFGTGEYPYKTVLKDHTCESTASVLSDLGYGTYAVHNNNARFYSRNHVFSQMGFDGFISREFMNIQEYTPMESWPTDAILRGEVQKALDDTPNQSDFVYTITVQGHGVYASEDIIENPEIIVSANGLDEETNNQWKYYVSQIHEVDKFVGDLVYDLSIRGEKTLVIFYGDHLPTMGLTNEDMATGDIFKTKYVTWNNFGMTKEDADITTYQLVAHMLDQVGIHNGTMISYHQSVDADLASETDETYIKNLELLQYDILYGEHYAYEEKDLYPATEIELGVLDAEIKNLRIVDGKMYISGRNFTPWSKVFINGEKQKTRQVNDTCLMIYAKEGTVEAGDEIVVNQCSGEHIFRSSNTVIYE